jgi:hypothetical protein
MDKFTWNSFLRYVKQLQIIGFYTVLSIFPRITKRQDVTDTVETTITGAAPMDAKLSQTKTRISQTWCLSETTSRWFHTNSRKFLPMTNPCFRAS